ncbi:UpxY family transcription antiterminator [Prolixibacteraceae bacterium Z1-6]|uniref:UpxY family transcription antiterminator n=1 Tax=Draconibacterium aestuarii TaxID=2998507 RepID=A0A9X3F254_9BACT|nr:UpxY family transcription antiterminator [Prolixibacteraceae bacterium Z1-6]
MHVDPKKKNWYAIYTRSRAEKKVEAELRANQIECFLPLQKKLRQWKDRKKWVDTPLMAGYCFVYINRKEYDKVLQFQNVVCYVTFEGKAAVIPSQQIHSLQKLLKQFEFEVTVSQENFEQGKQVEVIKGPLVGLRGELIDIRGKNKFILRVEKLESVFTIEISSEYISALPEVGVTTH